MMGAKLGEPFWKCHVELAALSTAYRDRQHLGGSKRAMETGNVTRLESFSGCYWMLLSSRAIDP